MCSFLVVFSLVFFSFTSVAAISLIAITIHHDSFLTLDRQWQTIRVKGEGVVLGGEVYSSPHT